MSRIDLPGYTSISFDELTVELGGATAYEYDREHGSRKKDTLYLYCLTAEMAVIEQIGYI